jgi:hypothetical protein
VRNPLPWLLIGGALLLSGVGKPEPMPPAAPPKPDPVRPAPCPPDKPWGRKVLDLFLHQPAPVGASVGGPAHADGTEISCDLPAALHQKNTGGSDGAGLCVYASNRHTGRWQNNRLFDELFDWMKRHPGGSYPSKFDKTLRQCAKEKGLPVPEFVQVESDDLEILKAACRTGRMPGVTYSYSPTGRYGGRRIAHMVSLVHIDDRWAVILDNNYPGADKYEWMTLDEFRRAYTGGGRSGWATILTGNPPPPPPPRN